MESGKLRHVRDSIPDLSIYRSLSIYLSICLSACLSVCLSISRRKSSILQLRSWWSVWWSDDHSTWLDQDQNPPCHSMIFQFKPSMLDMFSGFHIEYPPISPVNLWDPLQPCDDGYPNEPFLGAVLSLRTMQWDEKTLCLWSDMIFKWWKKTERNGKIGCINGVFENRPILKWYPPN